MHLAGLLVPPDGAAHSPFVGLDGLDQITGKHRRPG